MIGGQLIERERWLRNYYRNIDREGLDGKIGAILSIIWDFYYEGYLISITTKEIEKKYNDEKNELYIYMQILELKIPKEIENQKEQILKEFKLSFEASFGGIGIYAKKVKSCKLDLEYNGEII